MAEATAVKPRANPNFIRPGDPTRAMATKNFISREEANVRASEAESASGIAIRRPGESETSYKRRSKDATKRQRAAMSPGLARRELAQLERKWEGRTPAPEETDRHAAEFQYMNDCRAALGWPEVDYTQGVPASKDGDDTQKRFAQFSKMPAGSRLAACRDSQDLGVMRLAALHDSDEEVRQTAELQMQKLWAGNSAAK